MSQSQIGTPLLRSLSINLAGVMFVALTGFVAVLVMARWLSFAQFGAVSLLLLLFNSTSLLDGVRPVLVYLGAQSINLRRLLRTVEVMMATIGVLITCLCLVALTALQWEQFNVIDNVMFSIAVGFYFPLSAYWGLLDSQGETGFTGGLRSLAWSVNYLNFIFLAWMQASLTWYVVAMCMINVTLLVAYRTRLYTLHVQGVVGFDWALARRIWRDAADNLISNTSTFVLGSADRFALGWLWGTAQVGLYAGVYELTTKPAAFLRVLTAVLNPEAARCQNDARFTELWLRMLKLLFLAVTCGVFLVVFFRAEIVGVVLGEKFLVAADTFGLLSVGFIFVSVGYLANVPILAQGDFRTLRTLYVVFACGALALVWPLSTQWGITGASIWYLLTRSVDVVALCIALKRLLECPPWLRLGLAGVLLAGAMVAAWHSYPIVGSVFLLLLGWLGVANELRSLRQNSSE